MNQSNKYVPPKVWKWDKSFGGKFASINRPISGAINDKELPVGEHPFQLYSVATPNGIKITVMFEELLELGISEAEYDAWLININNGEQFDSGFVKANPNSKIPTLVDHSTKPQTRIFESGAMLVYLGEKFGKFLPKSASEKAECLSWLFWQISSTPYLGGGLGHFYAYAPEKLEYPINRYAMETKRQLDVLDKNLENRQFLIGDEYTIADIAAHPWYGGLVVGALYQAQEFLNVKSYKNVARWAKEIQKRPAVKRGQRVNKVWGDPKKQLRERHSSKDFETDS